MNWLAVVPWQAAANERAEVAESPGFPVQATSAARMSTHDNPFTEIALLNVLPVTLDVATGVCTRGRHIVCREMLLFMMALFPQLLFMPDQQNSGVDARIWSSRRLQVSIVTRFLARKAGVGIRVVR